MGRPPQDPLHVRSLRLAVRFSAAEAERLREIADQIRLPLRTFVREAALGAKLPRAVPAINAQLARDLARVGGNLNQLLQAIHVGKVKEPPLVDLLELQSLLAQVRRQLRGEGL